MLQGSLDNFGLDEVLGLLADTAKTGRMRITGDRGSGSLWLASGQLIGSEASRSDTQGPIEETMFELLRFNTGNFSFNMDEAPAEAGAEQPVAAVLEAAFERLTQWRAIEAVVPSLAHVIAPVSTLPAPEMTITSAEWDLLMAIGAGSEVGAVCEHFGLGEVEGSRRIKLLVERSLITIAPPLITPTFAPSSAANAESAVDAESVDATDSDDFGLAPAGLTTDDSMEAPTPATIGAFDAPVTSEQATPEPVGATAFIADETATPVESAERFGADVLGEAPAALPTESGFLDPGERELDRAWNPLSDAVSADAAAEAHPDAPTTYEAPAFEAMFEATAFEAPPAPSAEPSGVEPAVAEAAGFEPAAFEPPMPDASEFSFRSGPPSPAMPLRRSSDALPPPPPPAPPTAFDLYDAPTPPPPAPPAPADLVGSERVDGAEARRLLTGRTTDRYPESAATDSAAFEAPAFETVPGGETDATDEDDDGSLLMQFLRDES